MSRAVAMASTRHHGALSGIEPLARFGVFVRGVLYVLIGALALRLALGDPGAAPAPEGVIALVGRQAFGRALLVVAAVGLAGYALWGLARAVLDPFERGRKPMGVLQRLGYAVSGLGHAGLLFLTLRYLAGAGSTHSKGWIAFLLAQPAGAWLLGLVGVSWIIGAGLGQIVAGVRGTFKSELRLEHMHGSWRRIMPLLGRAGALARGLLFSIIGIFLVQTALRRNPGDAEGMEDAWLALLHEPYGRWILAVAALGIISFGLYSMLCARWMRVRLAL
jgi:hypothetical protein